MPWVKIDDGFPEHPKVAKAGALAMAMQVAALCYCNRKLTDGFVPRGIARTLLDFEVLDGDIIYSLGVNSGFSGEDVTADWVIARLIDADMWEPVDGGFRIVSYHDYQPSKADVEAEREAARERMAGLRRNRKTNTNGSSADVRANNERSSSSPVPVPDPSSSSSARAPKRDRSITEEEETECNQDRAFADACWLLAERAYNAQPPGAVKVKTPWMVSTRKERMDRHADAARAIFAVAPETPADELADLLEPDPSKPRPVLRRVYRCATCSDTGQVRNDDDLDLPNLLPCPDCSVVEGVSA